MEELKSFILAEYKRLERINEDLEKQKSYDEISKNVKIMKELYKILKEG